MRYTEVELQCEDLLWFGIDNNGYILSFYSGGIGNVPEFVIEDKERTILLQKYFLDKMKSNSDEKSLSAKGLYCFDVSYEDNYGNSYNKTDIPSTPLNVSNLPPKIYEAIQFNKIDVDVTTINKIIVKHAF